ncbi:MAG: cupin-like domain-containing protein [Alphaproteobacteria bacterium]|nr:MAG: cupin-like domain-containing protein [Alphaproteobacteria bacterium]
MIDRRIASIKRKIEEMRNTSPGAFVDRVSCADEPLVLRGLVSDWPALKHAQASHKEIGDYLLSFDCGVPVSCFSGPPELNGRIFYNEDFSGLNCQVRQTSLSEALERILEHEAAERPPLNYVGATRIETLLPGFAEDNCMPIATADATAYIWIGGPTRIAAHYDFSDNLACVVTGRRRFVLFPPDQLPNLYIGPLDFTPAGQPISLVDFGNLDFTAFPRFRTALDSAQIAELMPGDALFIPSMWWHHVEALSPMNILVNYWWRRSPTYLGAPRDALEHALMALRDLPLRQKEAWRQMFDYYVFNNNDDVVSHIPQKARGILGPMTERQARRLRATLLNRLNA